MFPSRICEGFIKLGTVLKCTIYIPGKHEYITVKMRIMMIVMIILVVVVAVVTSKNVPTPIHYISTLWHLRQNYKKHIFL